MKLPYALMLFVASVPAVSQIPAGAGTVEDQSKESAISEQIRDAEAALEKQDYKTAEAKLKSLALANPKDGRILYDLGFAEERNGEDAEAANSYAAASIAIAGFADPVIALGLLDARSGHLAEAHAELLKAAKVSSATPELRARALRALAHLDETEQPAAAQEELLEALRLTPETPDDVLTGAELAEHAGDHAAAESAYRRALKLMPGNIDATTGLAHVLQLEGKLSEADSTLSPRLASDPDDPRLVAQAASLYAAEGKEVAAIPLLEKLRADNPKFSNDTQTTQLLARLYYVHGDDAKAEMLYKTLLEKRPSDPVLLDALGSAQVKQGHDAEAEATLEKAVALRLDFHDDQAWAESAAHLAFAASKNNDPRMCLQALAARARVLPNSPSSLFLEGTAYDTLRQNKEAAKAYRAFLAMANGKYPDQEFEARHRLIALDTVR